MAVTIKLEWVGACYDRGKAYHLERFKKRMLRVDEHAKLFGAKTRKPWIAKLTKNGRDFLKGNTTYSDVDKKGERGIYFVFHLFEGYIYEICYWNGYKEKVRYKAEVKNNRLCRKDI